MQRKELIFPPLENKSLEKIIIPFSSSNIKRVNNIFNINSIFVQDIIFFNHNNFEITVFIERLESSNGNKLGELDTPEIEKIFVQFISVYEISKTFAFDFVDFKNFVINPGSGIKFAIILEEKVRIKLGEIVELFRENALFKDLSDKNYFEKFVNLIGKHHGREEQFYFYRRHDFASNILTSYPYSRPKNDLNIKVNIRTENDVQKSIVKSILRQHLFSEEIFLFNIEGVSNPIHLEILNQLSGETVYQADDFIDIINEFKAHLGRSSFKSVILIIDRFKTREEKEFVRYLLDSSNISNLVLIAFDECEPIDFDLVVKEKPENLFNRYAKFYRETKNVELDQEEIKMMKIFKMLVVPVADNELEKLFRKDEVRIINGLVKKKYLLSRAGKISIDTLQMANRFKISLKEERDILETFLPKFDSVNFRVYFLIKTGKLNQLRDTIREILDGIWENFDLDILKNLISDHYSIVSKDLKLMELFTEVLIRENDFDLARRIISDLKEKDKNFFELKSAYILHLEKNYQPMVKKLKKIKGELTDSLKNEFHYLKFVYYEKVADFKNADRYFRKIKNELFKNKMNILLSDRYIYSGKLKKAELLLEKAILFFHKNQFFRDKILALNQLAKLLREKRDFKGSEKLYKNIFLKSEIRNYQLLSAFIAVDIGNLYWIQDVFNQAEFWYQKALEIFKSKKNQNGRILVESNLVEIYKIQGKWKEAESYLKTTSKYDQEKNLLISKAIDLYNISHLEYMRRKYKQALEVVQQALQLFKQKNNLNGVIECLFLKYKILFFENSPRNNLDSLNNYSEFLNCDQKIILWLLNKMEGDLSGKYDQTFINKINEIDSRTLRFEIFLLIIHKYGIKDFTESLMSLSILLSQKTKNYFYYEYFWIYFNHVNLKNIIGEDEKDIFIEMYYFFLRNKRIISTPIQHLKKSLDERDSAYDIFKSAELVGDYIQWKIPEDFFKSFLKELLKKVKVDSVKLWIFEKSERLFFFSNKNEFKKLNEEMMNRAISSAEHLNLNSEDIKKSYQSDEKLFYPYSHTKVILWKISETLSAVVLLAFFGDNYVNTSLYENYKDFFKQFASLIQKYYENDYQLNKKLDFIIGESKAMKDLKQQILKVSKVDFSLLITGESGSGKELVAKAVHLLSKRSKQSFITINSAAIPEPLLEAELFGYKAGAFTGATENRVGLIESADKGTLFLDEIADLPMHLQAKLLRVLQENEIRRLGENQIRIVDIRLISATNRNLEDLTNSDRFREDLFFRIQDLSIEVPSLQERVEDISLLTRYFLKKYGFVLNDELEFQGIVEGFKQKKWKGNVRELESQIKRLITFYPNLEAKKNINQDSGLGLKSEKANFEKSLIVKTLSENNWNKVKTAQKLNISRVYLFDLIKKHNIQKTSL